MEKSARVYDEIAAIPPLRRKSGMANISGGFLKNSKGPLKIQGLCVFLLKTPAVYVHCLLIPFSGKSNY
jgi:hypothetical protein